MKPSFALRVFLTTFLPVALLLCLSFAAVRWLVQDRIKENLRASLRNSHEFVTRIRANYDIQNNKLLAVVAANPSLKAGMELVRQQGGSSQEDSARKTLDEQLSGLLEATGFDLALTTDANGRLTAGVMRAGGRIGKIDLNRVQAQAGLTEVGDHTFHLAAVPVDLAEEELGELYLGRTFDFAEFVMPAVLLKDGHVARSNIGTTSDDIESALRQCRPDADCEFRLGSETYVSMPIEKIHLGNGYVLRSLQSVDAAATGLSEVLETVFLATGAITLVTLVLVAVISARSVVKPVTALVSKLHESECTGVLLPLEVATGVSEMEDLADAFNRASNSVLKAHSRLTRAHNAFIRTITNALDARDVYTAGHSFRVSEYSCAIANVLGMPAEEIAVLRVGALIHDVGKIGVPDNILRKAGPLLPEEYGVIMQHPSIGRKILEDVEGFQPYLDIVELHHENHDGSGYPRGLRGDEIPLEARIVHVADAYDAMTSDRPYRDGMSHEDAIAQIRRWSGTQFDPNVAAAFLSLEPIDLAVACDRAGGDLARLAAAVEIRAAEVAERVLL